MTIEQAKATTDAFVVVADADGFITYVGGDPTGELGWRPEQLVGKLITTIIPLRFHDAHQLGFSRFLFTGRPTLLDRPLHLQVLTADGRELDAEHYIVAELIDGQWTFAAQIRPTRRNKP